MAEPKRRQSGKTAGQETASAAFSDADSLEDAHNPDLSITSTDIEQRKIFRSPNFSRVRIEWKPEDSSALTKIHEAVERAVQVEFAEAFLVLNQLYDVVRIPVLADGEPVKDQRGWVVWRTDQYGYPVEDWSLLTYSMRDDFLFRISTRLFSWEQKAAEIWGDAMFSKAIWEQQFAEQFYEPVAGTVADREAYGRQHSMEERYFAIFQSMLSRRADAVVRSMNLLCQRLKDSITWKLTG